jgi:hypothetical protein
LLHLTEFILPPPLPSVKESDPRRADSVGLFCRVYTVSYATLQCSCGDVISPVNTPCSIVAGRGGGGYASGEAGGGRAGGGGRRRVLGGAADTGSAAAGT